MKNEQSILIYVPRQLMKEVHNPKGPSEYWTVMPRLSQQNSDLVPIELNRTIVEAWKNEYNNHPRQILFG